MRFVNERTAVKVLLDGNGAIIAFTTSGRAYFFFITGTFVGGRIAPTTDPYAGIVEVCEYDIRRIVREWGRLYRVKLPTKKERRLS